MPFDLPDKETDFVSVTKSFQRELYETIASQKETILRLRSDLSRVTNEKEELEDQVATLLGRIGSPRKWRWSA